MRGPAGYGRYDDDRDHVVCPRAGTDMKPCIARDGSTALDDTGECVGCGHKPWPLLRYLLEATSRPPAQRVGAALAADRLRDLVREVTA